MRLPVSHIISGNLPKASMVQSQRESWRIDMHVTE